MSKTTVGMLDQLAHEIETAAGVEIAEQVMAGVEKITAKTKSEETALWVKGAMERFDALADEDTRVKAMSSCGLNCSLKNYTAIERGKARREKFATEEEFLAAELAKPQTGTRMERDGNLLYQIYTPTQFRRTMRCFCGLMMGLPEGELASRTYCQCSKAFATTFWQSVLGRPVKVEVLETALTGGKECRFQIEL